MNRETIIKLVQSTDPGDVTIGLNFLRHYRYRDIKEMFPSFHVTKKSYAVSLNCNNFELGFFKLQHHLYMRTLGSFVVFSPIPLVASNRYKSFLYEKGENNER